MKITDLRSMKADGRARVSATVTWEDCDRAAREIYFETDDCYSDSLTCDPHAFLVGCIVPAMHYGEKRIHIDAEVCPELRKGLTTAMTWLRHWFYDPGRQLVRIESGLRSGLTEPRPVERAGFFFSGGIDSFATLRSNRLHFPPEHPRSIRDGLLVFGLEQDDPELFKHVLASLSGVADSLDFRLIPVYTNVYQHYRKEDAARKFKFWADEFQGAALSAVAHAFSRRLTVVSIPSSDSLPSDALLNRKHVKPYGSHPVLDPNYSSAELTVQHDGITLSRLQKTRIVSDWDAALQHLRVCNMYRLYKPGALNCGRCEKCLRTMLALKVLGVSEKTGAFPVNDLDEALRLQKHLNPYYYLEMLPHLRAQGYGDLAKKIEKKIALYRKNQMISSWRTKIEGITSGIPRLSFSGWRSR
jgi:hypothetical protein